jgi:hypothetical protein
MVAFEDFRVCARCKPRFFQKLREGAFGEGGRKWRSEYAKFAAPRNRWGRTLGEKAFDRCFFSIVFLGVGILVLSRMPLFAFRMEALAQFFMGVVGAGLWVHALIGLIAGWRDPAARLLRFCALVFLLGLGISVMALLSAPLG